MDKNKFPKTARQLLSFLKEEDAPLAMRPTKEFKNKLPSGFPTWNYLLRKVNECFENRSEPIPANFYFDVIDPKEVHSYNFDLDFIKARCFEELNKIVARFADARNAPIYSSEYTEATIALNRDYSRLIRFEG